MTKIDLQTEAPRFRVEGECELVTTDPHTLQVNPFGTAINQEEPQSIVTSSIESTSGKFRWHTQRASDFAAAAHHTVACIAATSSIGRCRLPKTTSRTLPTLL